MLARRLLELTGNLPPAYHFVNAGLSWNGYIWPVLLDSPAQRESSLDYFHKHNVDAFVLWSEALYTACRFGYQAGMCPIFEDAFRRLFMLPCYAELTDKQRNRILEVVQSWAEQRKAYSM